MTKRKSHTNDGGKEEMAAGDILKLKDSGYTLAQAQESVKADIDRRVESFMRLSIELAYQNTDDVVHARGDTYMASIVCE